MITFTVGTPDAMAELGARIATQLRAGDIVALDGELGAGKTTLTRGLGAALEVSGTVASPTFVLARTHAREHGGPPLVHVDAYRLGSAAELDDLDIDFAASIVVVEWAAGMLDGLSDSVLQVSIARPMGAGSGSAMAGSARGAGSAGSGSGGPGSARELDSADDLGDGIEPRQVTIVPIGPRWAAHPFS